MTTTASDQVFRLPDLGEGLTEAEVVKWWVQVGDEVRVDETIAEVETAKSIVEVPSPYAGTVTTLHADEGGTVAVGAPLITIGAADASGAADGAARAYREEERAGSGNVLIGYGTGDGPARGRRRAPRGTAAPAVPAPAPAPAAPAPEVASRRPVASPVVRRLARDGGVDLAAVAGTGADGLVTRSDVVRALAARDGLAAAAPTGPASGERRTALSSFRRTVAASLSRSRAEIPEATVWVDVDATALWELRESTRTPGDPGPGILAYLARFVVAGLKRYPVLNARVDTERQEIVEHDHVHLGIAVQGERGLVVPAVLGADAMTTAQLDGALRDLTERARAGRATAEELAAGTFTLNNYGGFRVDGSAAIINHPQVAILGFGRILDRAWVVDGEIVPRKITQMSFVFDHRVCDGGTAAGFMRVVADAIEDPATAIRDL
ncbi:dihydrolipoamide acetyltransferase family protein [Nocardioides sp. MH1]|uniref:dihydrolipoamide acetyltransferase family protein n=1 Tax=Nocardioides sp. MH1 TaxID=3242490 RepID=UPI0035208019